MAGVGGKAACACEGRFALTGAALQTAEHRVDVGRQLVYFLGPFAYRHANREVGCRGDLVGRCREAPQWAERELRE